MVTTLSERLAAFFTGVKERSAPIRSREQVTEILRACKRVRAKDYVFDFSLPNGGIGKEKLVTTTANWFFVCTGVSSWLEQSNSDVWAKVAIMDFCPDSPFNSAPEMRGAYPLISGLSLQLNGGRFEEYKNLWYVLGQRVTLGVTAQTAANEPARGSVIVTGIEFDLQGGI